MIDGHVLKRVDEYKYLGVIISADLKFNKHVSYITAKALSALYSLKRSLKSASSETKLLAYISLVRSILEYGIISWFPHTKTCVEKLESVQRKAVRFIFNKYRRHDSPTELLARAGLPTISSRARILRLKFLFVLLNDGLRIEKTHFLTPSNTRSTRAKHSRHLTEYRFHTDTFKYSFFPKQSEIGTRYQITWLHAEPLMLLCRQYQAWTMSEQCPYNLSIVVFSLIFVRMCMFFIPFTRSHLYPPG